MNEQYGIDLTGIKAIVSDVLSQREIRHVAFVGCGASMSELYSAVYFLQNNSDTLCVTHSTANEFNFDTPAWLGRNTLVITCSLGGNTPETIEANKTARAADALVVGITREEGSGITKDVDYTVIHRSRGNFGQHVEKQGCALALAVEILEQTEGYNAYSEMMEAFDKIFPLCDRAAQQAQLAADRFAETHKDESTIYFMGSGASAMTAYASSLFLAMEMQWIDSGHFNTGEYFHGPFELTEQDKPFVLFMSDGPTRPMDARALTFLQRFDAKVTVIDAKDYALGAELPASVAKYFNAMLHSAVVRKYVNTLAEVRLHPMSVRRYMWKIEY